MKYDITIFCTENDSYLGDLICQEMEARGKKVLFNLRDMPQPDKAYKCVYKSPVYIAVVNQEFLQEEHFKLLTKYESGFSDVATYLFINEEGVVLPKKWKKYELIDANAGWEDSMMNAIASGQSVAGLCDAPDLENQQQVYGNKDVASSIGTDVSVHKQDNMSEIDEQTRLENVFGRHLSDRIAEMLLPEEPSSMMVKRAMKYLHGDSVVKDIDRAFALLERAVREDPEDSEACYYLAVFNESDEIESGDMEEAKRLYEVSLSQGFIPSKLRLGYLTLNDSTPGSQEKAMEIFKQCRKEGDFRASYWIGLYAEIMGDYENAYEYYSEAAEEGFAPAQNALGCMYADGLEVKQDETKALEWFRLAASQNLPVAMANLGDIMIRMGGMSKDAQELIRTAASLGDERGKALSRKLDRIADAERQEAIRKRKEAERQAQMESLINTVGDTLGKLFSGTR